MTEFVVNDDMFGRYCEIETNFSRSLHIYKIVSLIESNGYCDIPLTNQSKPIWHKDIVPVLLVIHCGIDETRVQRVALSDCKVRSILSNEIFEAKAKAKVEAYKEFAERLKNKWFDERYYSPDVDFDDFIDNLLKESER